MLDSILRLLLVLGGILVAAGLITILAPLAP
jgi:hypothetical protein